MSKQYGLILPNKEGTKKAAPIFSATRNVFGNDSDSDDNVKVSQIPVASGEKSKRQAKAVQSKVLDEDPTVYQYDELYDDISSEKNKKKQSAPIGSKDSKAAEEKKPKYIGRLLQVAERRKKENERRVERQIQKERDEEGEKFADKEAFVTSAYKKKLEELREEEERERREEYLEEIGDVTKQSDLGGFYRHLYEQQLRPEKQTPDAFKKDATKTEEQKQSPGGSDEEDKPEKAGKEDKIKKDKRSYRKRKSSMEEDSKNNENSEIDEEINRKAVEERKHAKKTKIDPNLDADSDFSIDESTSESDEEKDKKTSKKEDKDEKTVEISPGESKEKDVTVSDDFKKPNDVIKTEIPDKKEVKPKIDIWKKRTVGEVFDQALERYYKRKAMRGGG